MSLPDDFYVEHGRAYFSESFNAANDIVPRIGKPGVGHYSNSWWGWFLARLGCAVQLVTKNGTKHYFYKKELETWLDYHDPRPASRNTYSRIATIGLRSVAEQVNRQKAVLKQKNEISARIERERAENQKRLEEERRANQKRLEEERIAEQQRLEKEKLAEQERLKQEEIQKQARLEQAKNKLDKGFIEIDIGNEVIVANPKRVAQLPLLRYHLDAVENHDVLTHLNELELAKKSKEIEEMNQKLAVAKKKLDDAKKEFKEANESLVKANNKIIEPKKNQAEEPKKSLEEIKKNIKDAAKKLHEVLKSNHEMKKTLEKAETNLENAHLVRGEAERRFENAKKKLDKKGAEESIEIAKKELKDAKSQNDVELAQQKLLNAREMLNKFVGDNIANNESSDGKGVDTGQVVQNELARNLLDTSIAEAEKNLEEVQKAYRSADVINYITYRLQIAEEIIKKIDSGDKKYKESSEKGVVDAQNALAEAEKKVAEAQKAYEEIEKKLPGLSEEVDKATSVAAKTREELKQTENVQMATTNTPEEAKKDTPEEVRKEAAKKKLEEAELEFEDAKKKLLEETKVNKDPTEAVPQNKPQRKIVLNFEDFHNLVYDIQPIKTDKDGKALPGMVMTALEDVGDETKRPIKYTMDTVEYHVKAIEFSAEAFEVLRRYLEGETEEVKEEASALQTQSESLIQVSQEASVPVQEGPQTIMPQVPSKLDIEVEGLEPEEGDVVTVITQPHEKRSYAPPIDKPQPVVPVPKRELEGTKDIADLIKPELLPELLPELYELHTLIPIEPILAIARNNIDFYSNKPLTLAWEGSLVSPHVFWTSLAKKYGDKQLEKLCTEKYKGIRLVEPMLKQINENRANKNVAFKCTTNPNGTINLVLEFKADPYYNPQIFNYHQNQLSFLNNWTRQQLKNANISSIVIDVRNLLNNTLSNSPAVFHSLIRGINQHLAPRQTQDLELIIRGCPQNLLSSLLADNVFKGVAAATDEERSPTEWLLTKYGKVQWHFEMQCSSQGRQQVDYKKVRQDEFNRLFDSLGMPGYHTEVSYSFTSKPTVNWSYSSQKYDCALSAQATNSNTPERRVRVCCDQSQPDHPTTVNMEDFAWINHPVKLTLQLDKKALCGVNNLDQLQISDLTIEDAMINNALVTQIKGLMKNSKRRLNLTLKNCEIAEDAKTSLKEILDERDLSHSSVNLLEEAIKRSNNDCQADYSHNSAKQSIHSCRIGLQTNPDDTSSLILKFNRDKNYSIADKERSHILWNSNYYRKRLSFLADSIEEIKKAKISSIIIDIKDFMTTIQSDRETTTLVEDKTQIAAAKPVFLAQKDYTPLKVYKLNDLEYVGHLLSDVHESLINAPLIETSWLPSFIHSSEDDHEIKVGEEASDSSPKADDAQVLLAPQDSKKDPEIKVEEEASNSSLKADVHAQAPLATQDINPDPTIIPASRAVQPLTFIIQDLDIGVLNSTDLTENDLFLFESFQELLQDGHTLKLNITEGITGNAALTRIFDLLAMDGYYVEIAYSPSHLAQGISISAKKSPTTGRCLRLSFDKRFDLYNLNTISPPIDLILHQNTQNKQTWMGLNLNQLRVQNLTIENVILDSDFAEQIKYGERPDQLDNLVHLTLNDCTLPSNIQKLIEESFEWRNITRDGNESERHWSATSSSEQREVYELAESIANSYLLAQTKFKV